MPSGRRVATSGNTGVMTATRGFATILATDARGSAIKPWDHWPDSDRSEEPNLNTGIPWSSWGDEDIRWGLDHDRSIEETADFLCRTPSEIRQRIREIAEADAIGDPLLLGED
jgi:hypothetical protein